MRRLAFVVFTVLMLSPAPGSVVHAQGKPWWADLVKPGPFQVGFTTKIIYDESRLSPENKPRWVQFGYWYPSSRYGVKPLSYGDYIRIAAAETTGVAATIRGNSDVKAFRDLLVSRGASGKEADAFVDGPLFARRDAPSHPGPFSLIVLAQGNGQSAGDQAVLGEYLASYGYWVLTSPSQSRITGEPRSDDKVGEAAIDQLADMWLIQRQVMMSLMLKKGEGMAVIGHSFGGRSALFFGMSDPRMVKAIVSLDGGIGTATAREPYESSRAFIPSAPIAPLLHIYEDRDPPMTPDWGTLKKLTAAREIWIAKAGDLHHHHFTTLGAASGKFPEVGKATGATENTGPQYAATLELTLAFIEATLHKDSTMLKKIQAKPGALTMERLP